MIIEAREDDMFSIVSCLPSKNSCGFYLLLSDEYLS